MSKEYVTSHVDFCSSEGFIHGLSSISSKFIAGKSLEVPSIIIRLITFLTGSQSLYHLDSQRAVTQEGERTDSRKDRTRGRGKPSHKCGQIYDGCLFGFVPLQIEQSAPVPPNAAT